MQNGDGTSSRILGNSCSFLHLREELQAAFIEGGLIHEKAFLEIRKADMQNKGLLPAAFRKPPAGGDRQKQMCDGGEDASP